MVYDFAPLGRQQEGGEARASAIMHPLTSLADRAMATGIESEQNPLSPPSSEQLSSRAQAIINERARRSEYFPAELFGEPAWEILLELYAAQLASPRVTSSQIANATTFPATTTLRWLKVLDAAGFVDREPDPLDGQQVFLSLTPKALCAMRSYLFPVEDEELLISEVKDSARCPT